jgi:hypothetical protein
MASLDMRIVFRQHGGFAPVFKGCELDLDQLEPAEAAKIRQLVETSGLLEMTDRRVPGAADVHNYDLHVETERGTHRVSFDALSVPASVRPLIALLRAKSHDLLPDV